MNKDLFRRISALLAGYDPLFGFDEKPRYINFGGKPYEQHVASKGNVLVHFKAALIEALLVKIPDCGSEEASLLWLLSGCDFDVSSVASPFSLSSEGASLLFQHQGEFRLTRSPQSVYDIASLEPEEGYNGHDFLEISSCFRTVYTHPGNPEVCASHALSEILSSDFRIDKIDNEDTKHYRDRDVIACEYELSVLNSSLNFGNRRQFLELYTIIESLYFRIFCRNLYSSLEINTSEENFYQEMERTIGWRPKETDALERIITFIHENDSNILEIIIRECGIQMEKVNPKNVSEKIYGLRNDCVHWRHSKINIKSSKIRSYSILCLKLLENLDDLLQEAKSCTCLGTLEIS